MPAWLGEAEQPLGFLIHPDSAHTIIDAAYRYCRHEPGTDVILFGTGNPKHLRSNIDSILSDPLPAVDLEQIKEAVRSVRGCRLGCTGAAASRLKWISASLVLAAQFVSRHSSISLNSPLCNGVGWVER